MNDKKTLKYKEWFICVIMIIFGVIGSCFGILWTPILMLLGFIVGITICIFI